MAISSIDIKTKASERLTDYSDGGGRMTGTDIQDGVMNNLFPDQSRLDRVYGRVNLRKCFVHIDAANTDTYYGSISALMDAPDDPNVSGVLFSTGSHTDERDDAQDRIESYVVKGTQSRFWLFDRQLSGQRSILLFGPVNAALPEVGDVMYLVQDEGEGGEFYQYVRITDVTSDVQEFSHGANTSCGTFNRLVVTCGISAALENTFDGPEITCLDSINPDALFRDTLVADASKYYGVAGLNENIANGDLTINAVSIYAQLVPSTRGESPLVDVQAGGLGSQIITSGGEDFEVIGPVHTSATEITIGNRAYTYVFSCSPIPAAGTLTVDFRAQGRWYRLQDNGSGELEGEGTGTVNFSTGSVQVTLSALPDTETSIMLTWSTTVHFIDRAGTANYDPVVVNHTLAGPVTPGTLSIEYLSGAVPKTITDDGNGTLIGDGDGYVVYSTGEFEVEFTTDIPDANSQLTVDYDEPATELENFTGVTLAGGIATLALSTFPIEPGSVIITWDVEQEQQSASEKVEYLRYLSIGGSPRPATRIANRSEAETTHLIHNVAQDDGAGGFAGITGASINYADGSVSIRFTDSYSYYNYSAESWSESSLNETFGGACTVKYMQDTPGGSSRQEFVDLPPLTLNLLSGVQDDIIPGTLRFSFGGIDYSDRSGQGTLYLTDDTVAGSVDYDKRLVSLSEWVGAVNVTVNVVSMISTYGSWYQDVYDFRTNGAPLQPGSMIITATATDGSFYSISSDLSGNLTGDGAVGTIDQQTGVCNITMATTVFPNTVKYNAVVYSILPLDADILGLDPVRLPSDGRVPIFRPADVGILTQNDTFTCSTPLVADEVETLPQDYIAWMEVVDQNDAVVAAEKYTIDLEAGTVTMANPLDLTGYVEPLKINYRFEDMRLISDVQVNGAVSFTTAVYHDFDTAKAVLSSALIHGDLQARYHTLFEQTTWTSIWSDELIGGEPVASYNDSAYPLLVDNRSAIKERWLIKFTSSTAFEVIGETVGLIASGNTVTDLDPLNPETSTPYFTMYASGWGSGWSTGNCVRFNTEAGAASMWIARTTLSGNATEEEDSMTIWHMGDAD